MNTRSITDQIHIIKKATEKASSSKEAAIAFLRNAGIIGVIKRDTIVGNTSGSQYAIYKPAVGNIRETESKYSKKSKSFSKK